MPTSVHMGMNDMAGRHAVPAPTAKALHQAAEWFAILGASSVSDKQREEWLAWVNAHPSHRASWQRVELIGGKFANLPTPSVNKAAVRDVLENAARHGMQRRKSLGLLGAFLGIGALGAWNTARLEPWHGMLATHGTGTGERQQYQLADGTALWLNTKTSLDVEYDAGLRRIVLRRGEILVETHPDVVVPARPFVVDTRHGRLQALGTRFAVSLQEDHTQLTVFKSAVRVMPAQSSQSMIVEEGQGVRFATAAINPVEPASTSRQAWTQGLLLAENMRLDDFLAELSRYRRGPSIDCASSVAGLRIVGAYRLDNTDAILQILQDTLPISVQRPLPWWIRVTAR